MKHLLVIALLALSGCGLGSTARIEQAREVCAETVGPIGDIGWNTLVTTFEIARDDGITAGEAVVAFTNGCPTLSITQSEQIECIECSVALIDAVWD